MAAVRRGANFRGLQMEWKGAFSRHFAINFSSASGFEARGGGGRPVGGQIESFCSNLDSRSQNKGGVSWLTTITQWLFIEEQQRLVYTWVLFGWSEALLSLLSAGKNLWSLGWWLRQIGRRILLLMSYREKTKHGESVFIVDFCHNRKPVRWLFKGAFTLKENSFLLLSFSHLHVISNLYNCHFIKTQNNI